MANILNRFLLLLFAAMMLIGCSSTDTTDATDSEDAEESTAVTQDTSDVSDKTPSTVGTDNPIDLSAVTMETFEGTYDADIEIPQEFIDMMVSMAEQFGEDTSGIEEEIKNTKMTLVLNGDGTYETETISKDETVSENGTWSLSDDGTELTMNAPDNTETQTGQPDPEPMVLAVSPNGKVLSFEDTQMGMTSKITFTKQ